MLPNKAKPQQVKKHIKYRTGIVCLEKDIKVKPKQLRNGQIIIPTIPYCKRRFLCSPPASIHNRLQASFYEPQHVTGFRSTTVYHEKRIRAKLEKLLGIKITRWDTDPLEENGVFYQGLSKGKKKELPGVHSDEPYNDITLVIYLVPGLPVGCGTSLWMHKETGLIDPVTPAAARSLKNYSIKLWGIGHFGQDS